MVRIPLRSFHQEPKHCIINLLHIDFGLGGGIGAVNNTCVAIAGKQKEINRAHP
jgi:hypothetical protein